MFRITSDKRFNGKRCNSYRVLYVRKISGSIETLQQSVKEIGKRQEPKQLEEIVAFNDSKKKLTNSRVSKFILKEIVVIVYHVAWSNLTYKPPRIL